MVTSAIATLTNTLGNSLQNMILEENQGLYYNISKLKTWPKDKSMRTGAGLGAGFSNWELKWANVCKDGIWYASVFEVLWWGTREPKLKN